MAHSPIILVSLCLRGERCLYHGGQATFAIRLIRQLEAAGCTIWTACPEVLGGLSTPRPPCRRQGDRILAGGQDVTRFFERGRDLALEGLQEKGGMPDVAVLLADSPACDPRTGVFGKALVQARVICIAAKRDNGWEQLLLDILAEWGISPVDTKRPPAVPGQLQIL